MKVLVKHQGGVDTPVHPLKGTVVEAPHSVSQYDEVVLKYLTPPSEAPFTTTLHIPRGHTDFRVDSLADKIIRIPVPDYGVIEGERVIMYDAEDFKGDPHGIVHPEGLQHLTADGVVSKSWNVGGKNYMFKEMPQG